jgi:hypothetical protein
VSAMSILVWSRHLKTSSLSVVMGWWPTPAHENVAWSRGDVGFAWCS